MALSTNTYTYAGGAQTFAVNFALGFIQRSDVTVRVNLAVDGSGDPAYTPFEWIDDATILVTPTLTIGDSVRLDRTVSKSELKVNFAAGADITPANLDLSSLHGMMVYQELADGRIDYQESPEDAAVRAATAALESEASAAAAALDAAAAALSASNLIIDQGVSTTDSPTFVAVTAGDMNITGPTPFLTLTDDDLANRWTRLYNENGDTFIDLRNGGVGGQFIIRGFGSGVVDEYARFDANGNFSATGSVTAGNFIGSESNPTITSADADGYLAISGDSTVDTGANIRLFSAAHATKAGDFSVRNDTTTTLKYDSSATNWNFQANDVTTTGTVTATSYAGDGSALTGLDEFTYTGSAPLFACRAWGNVGSDALVDGGNFASWDGATDTVTFTTAMPHANYAVSMNGPSYGNCWASNITTTGFTVNQRSSGGNFSNPTNFEFTVVC